LRLQAENIATLESGMVYADSGNAGKRSSGLVIHTEHGTVSDIGTQFLVQVVPDHFGVVVREGSVDIASDEASYLVVAGNKLTIREDLPAERVKVSATDETWNWAIELAPDFEMENKSLFEFLEWAARETGKELVFASNETLDQVRSTTLFGDVRGFTPIEAIDSVLATTSVRYRVEEDRIIVGNR
jgi:ferric-dicitrate binding protein FerR (iron transport regulator)